MKKFPNLKLGFILNKVLVCFYVLGGGAHTHKKEMTGEGLLSIDFVVLPQGRERKKKERNKQKIEERGKKNLEPLPMGSIYVHNSTPIIFLSTSQSYILFSKLSNQIESLFFLKKMGFKQKKIFIRNRHFVRLEHHLVRNKV